jgi:glutathione S-transferase
MEARAVSWMSYIASTLHPARRQGLDHALEVYRITEKKMGDGDWLLGAYSIADIHLFRLFWRLRNSLNLAPEQFPKLVAHHDRMMQRPAVRRTLEIESAIGYNLP